MSTGISSSKLIAEHQYRIPLLLFLCLMIYYEYMEIISNN